jgi:hypothetical protein
MPSSETYRHHAAEARRLASQAEGREREVLLSIADGWDRLAAHKAQIEANNADKPR